MTLQNITFAHQIARDIVTGSVYGGAFGFGIGASILGNGKITVDSTITNVALKGLKYMGCVGPDLSMINTGHVKTILIAYSMGGAFVGATSKAFERSALALIDHLFSDEPSWVNYTEYSNLFFSYMDHWG